MSLKIKSSKLERSDIYAVIYHRHKTVFYNLDFKGERKIYVFK